MTTFTATPKNGQAVLIVDVDDRRVHHISVGGSKFVWAVKISEKCFCKIDDQSGFEKAHNDAQAARNKQYKQMCAKARQGENLSTFERDTMDVGDLRTMNEDE